MRAQCQQHPNSWFLDSIFSSHIIEIKSLPKELDESYKKKVRLGDDKQVQGKGNVAVNNGHGNIKFFTIYLFLIYLKTC